MAVTDPAGLRQRAAVLRARSERDLAEARRRLANATAHAGAPELTVHIEADVVLVAIGKVIRRLEAAVRDAREAESSAAGLALAESEQERAVTEADAIARADRASHA